VMAMTAALLLAATLLGAALRPAGLQ
jgi:hypothetical protein